MKTIPAHTQKSMVLSAKGTMVQAPNNGTQMKNYYIGTDSGRIEIKAESLADALRKWGEAPASVTTAEQWEKWLAWSGGYGTIHEDGIPIARVSADTN